MSDPTKPSEQKAMIKPALRAVRMVAVKPDAGVAAAAVAPIRPQNAIVAENPRSSESVTPDPVLAGRSADMRDLPQSGQPVKPVTEQTPTPQIAKPPLARFDDRTRARAELASVYAGWQGVDLALNDILEHLARDFPNRGELGLTELAAVLNVQGMSATLETAHWCTPDQWPAIAQMVNGQLVLVLSQTEGTITIYDPTQTDRRAEVSVVEFDPYFSGLTLKARPTIAKISETHISGKLSDHWFWGEFARQKRSFSEIALGSFVANLLAIAVALFSLQVYDRVIPHQSQATLWVLAIGAVLALGLEAVLKIARARLMDAAGRRIELSVQKRLMDRLLGMKSQPGGPSPSTLFQAMREFGSVREFFTASTVGTIADIPFIIVFLLLVAFIGGPVVWVLIAGGVLMVLPSLFLQKRMVALTKQSQGASAKAARILHETIFEHETLRSQRGEDRVRRLWSEMLTLTSSNSSEQRKLASALTYWAQGVQQATYVAAVITGAYLVFAGVFTVGTIIAIGILTGRTLAPLSQLAGTLSRWTNVKAALEGLEAIAGAEQTEIEGRSYLRRDHIRGEYELRNVSFRYDKDAGATVDVQALAINPGQKIAVLGPNGSGKSTLLRLLAGLYSPESGRILLDGVEMAQIHPRDLRRNIGYLGQEVRLFAGSLRDNLNLTQLERDEERLFKALEFAGLAPFVKGHPKGLDMEIRDGGEGLSVGQRQSIGWARVWLQDPPVVLLDEPTAALDQTLETTLVDRLGAWLQGRTALIATHRVPILALTDRVILLQNGKPTVDGPRAAVLAHLATGGKAANGGPITGTIAGGLAG